MTFVKVNPASKQSYAFNDDFDKLFKHFLLSSLPIQNNHLVPALWSISLNKKVISVLTSQPRALKKKILISTSRKMCCLFQ